VTLRTTVERHLPDGGREVTSDSDGTFEFRGLRSGEAVWLEAALDGYTQEHEAIVRVPSDEPVRLRLARSAIVRGRVVAADGAGVEDAVIFARPTRPWSPRPRSPRESQPPRSGSDGRFELHLGSGEWMLQAHPPDEALGQGSHTITVEAAEIVEDVVIELRPARVVTGTIVDDDGNPVPRAQVSVQFQSPSASGSAGGALSDAAGHYRASLDGMFRSAGPSVSSAASYAVEVRHSDFRPARKELDAAATGEVRADFRLERGLEIAGVVLGPSGEPVRGATVFEETEEPSQALAVADSRSPEQTDRTGRFVLRGLGPGSYVVHASAPEYVPASSAAIQLHDMNIDGVVLELGEGVKLRGRVSGLEVDDLARVSVRAMPTEVLDGRRLLGIRRRFWDGDTTARPDFEGNFQIEGLAPGRHLVRAELDATGSGRSVQTEVDVTAGAAPFVELEFGDGFALSGLVQVEGVPAPGLRVLVLAEGIGSSQTVTDVHGRFVVDGLAAGELSVTVQWEGSWHYEPVKLDGDREILIDLHPSAVSGTVVAAVSGEPVAGARVTATSLDQDIPSVRLGGYQETLADGSFSLRLGEGRFSLRVMAPGFASRELSIDAPAGGELVGLLVELEPAAEAVLRVIIAGGAPPPAAISVGLSSPGSPPSAHVDAAALGDGRFALGGLGPGAWDLWVGAEGGSFERVTVTAPGPEVAVVLRAAGMLAVEAPSFADAAARLELIDATGAAFEHPYFDRLPMQRGRTVLPGLPAGTWRVRVIAEDGRVVEATAVVEAGGTTTVEIP
jgi:hypothetical protein